MQNRRPEAARQRRFHSSFCIHHSAFAPIIRPMLFTLVQTVYWLALSTWFGGVLFVAVAAQVIFRTVRENDPLLPTVLSVNLEGQHGTLLAGSIVAHLLKLLVKVQLGCAAAVGLALAAQWVVISPERYWGHHLVRSAL